MSRHIRDDTDSGFCQYPVGTDFPKTDILDRGLSSVDVGSALAGVHSGGVHGGVVPGVMGGGGHVRSVRGARGTGPGTTLHCIPTVPSTVASLYPLYPPLWPHCTHCTGTTRLLYPLHRYH